MNITNDLTIQSADTDTVARPQQLAKPTRALLKATGEAIRDFDLIRNGDRVLVALSGGKDSMALLHVLLDLQRRAPVKFELAAATIDPQMPGYDPSVLSEWVTSLGITHYLQSYSLGRYAHGSLQGKSLCAFCSRMRRGKLHGLAREHKFNVIALGHHLDDAAETFLMNSFFGGQLRSMRAIYQNDDGDLRIIRPLIYAREHQTATDAENAQLPLVADNCPSCDAKPTQRNAMKALLENLEHNHNNLFGSLKTALKPLLAGTPCSSKDTQPSSAELTEHPLTFIPPPFQKR
ncbi:MAG: tRNA 2-thiocytidine biosynthesis protein TtcA [Gammaproteobacteria bacterium]|nr:MAG: tRNA 2-thiocytidine biosynthesis protein TtcA [Gammaproteobacteria bacterium]RLA17616.1 MAG: tRNA 2-thiocytidine biosynthesis protein TtcA [Gammaproteobacteria bacterium]